MRKQPITLFCEYFSHYLLCALILVVGGLAPTFAIILFGGPLALESFTPLTSSMQLDTVLYGMGLNVLIHGVTGGWWILRVAEAMTETQVLHQDCLTNLQA